MRNAQTWLFVEVKEVEGTDDLSDYISSKKLQTLEKTIAHFLAEHGQSGLEQQLVVVCTKNNRIYHTYYYEG